MIAKTWYGAPLEGSKARVARGNCWRLGLSRWALGAMSREITTPYTLKGTPTRFSTWGFRCVSGSFVPRSLRV